MNPTQRVLNTVNRQLVDKVPVDLWLTPEILHNLRIETGLEDELEIYRALDVDKLVWVFPGYKQAFFDPNESDGKDTWGVPTFQVQSGQARYQEYGAGPLADMLDPEELDSYPLWPQVDAFKYDEAFSYASRCKSMGFPTIGPWISLFEIYCHMRGMEEALMDVVADPEFLNAALDRIEKIQSQMLDEYLTKMGTLIDMVFISDDMGTQESQLISPAAFSEHLKPRLKRWCDQIHGHGKKVFFHTDGAAEPFIPHLIECGIDILNPIQHRCPGMDCRPLKEKYGDQLIFHGGIENQYVLPLGSAAEVRREVQSCLETLGENGGYIPCSCHNIQAGTPVENVLALIEAVRSCKTFD